jgi:hypothetical protein
MDFPLKQRELSFEDIEAYLSQKKKKKKLAALSIITSCFSASVLLLKCDCLKPLSAFAPTMFFPELSEENQPRRKSWVVRKKQILEIEFLSMFATIRSSTNFDVEPSKTPSPKENIQGSSLPVDSEIRINGL